MEKNVYVSPGIKVLNISQSLMASQSMEFAKTIEGPERTNKEAPKDATSYSKENAWSDEE